jgi:hypothetical protein
MLKGVEQHLLRAAGRTGPLLTGESGVRITTYFPVVVLPRRSLQEVLMQPTEELQASDEPMLATVGSYIVELLLGALTKDDGGFQRLVTLSAMVNEPLFVWVEHYFTPQGSFAAEFLNYMCDKRKLEIIKSAPRFFFMVLFKAIVVTQAFDLAALRDLFAAVAKLKENATLLKSAATFLVQVWMVRPLEDGDAVVHELAHGFLVSLKVASGLVVFDYIISDVSFLVSLISGEFGPLRLLLSFFFRTLNEALIENKAGVVRKAVETLCLLASTLERHACSSRCCRCCSRSTTRSRSRSATAGATCSGRSCSS